MEFVEEPNFTKAIQRFPDSDYAAFQEDLAAHPEQGDLVRGTGGFRKARMGFPSAGIGKSGGARVIYFPCTGTGNHLPRDDLWKEPKERPHP